MCLRQHFLVKEKKELSDLYWTGGPAKVQLSHSPTIPESKSAEAVRILDDFRSQCQRLWFAFSGLINGRPLAIERLHHLKVERHNRLSVGTQFPDQDQGIGRSTFAQITFGELCDGMADGGEFEQLNAKAYLVFICALWEGYTRKKIADLLQVKQREVKCELMADLCRLRNLIIHRSEKAKQTYVNKAKLLPQIWAIDPHNLVVTASMLQALIEQLNAIHVDVG